MLGRERTRLDRRGRPSSEELTAAKDYGEYVGVYCLYSNGRLIYVGETGLGTQMGFFQRLRQHRRGPIADQWDEYSWFGLEKRPADTITSTTLGALAQLEAVLIAVINPGSNRQGGAFHGATQVFQVPHDLSDGDIETKLGRVLDALKRLEDQKS